MDFRELKSRASQILSLASHGAAVSPYQEARRKGIFDFCRKRATCLEVLTVPPVRRMAMIKVLRPRTALSGVLDLAR